MKKIAKILITENIIVTVILVMLWIRVEPFLSYPFYLMLLNASIIIAICLIMSYRKEKAYFKNKPLGG